jgi:hypothetical protein
MPKRERTRPGSILQNEGINGTLERFLSDCPALTSITLPVFLPSIPRVRCVAEAFAYWKAQCCESSERAVRNERLHIVP